MKQSSWWSMSVAAYAGDDEWPLSHSSSWWSEMSSQHIRQHMRRHMRQIHATKWQHKGQKHSKAAARHQDMSCKAVVQEFLSARVWVEGGGGGGRQKAYMVACPQNDGWYKWNRLGGLQHRSDLASGGTDTAVMTCMPGQHIVKAGSAIMMFSIRWTKTMIWCHACHGNVRLSQIVLWQHAHQVSIM